MNTNLFFSVAQTAPHRFRGIAYSGGQIPAYGPYGNAAIDLDSLELPKGKLFALVDHDPQKRAGQFTASRDGGCIVVEGTLFQSTEAGREVAALLEEGAPWQMSVGIQAKAMDVSGQFEINGQLLELDTIFKDASLREVSFVPIGADPNTSVAAFERQPPKEDDPLEIEELKAELEKTQAELESARQELSEIRHKERQAAIEKLSADIGQSFEAAEKEAFEALDSAAFQAMAAVMIRSKPVPPPHLFEEQATNGKSKEAEHRDALKIAQAAILKQVSGK